MSKLAIFKMIGGSMKEYLTEYEEQLKIKSKAIEKAYYYLNPNPGETIHPILAQMWLRTSLPATHPNYMTPTEVEQFENGGKPNA